MESLYEELSLFEGGLLATGSWSNKDVNEVRDVSGEEGWLSPGMGADEALLTSPVQLFPELLSSCPPSPLDDHIDGTVLEPNWLDTSTNLLDFIDVQQPQLNAEVAISDENPLVVSFTDNTAVCLALDKLGSEIVTITPSSDTPSGVPGAELEMSFLEIVNKLTDSLEEQATEHYGEIEQPGVIPVQPLLSPISLEEVESLLASQPTSPSLSMDDSGYVEDALDDPAYSPGPSRGSLQHHYVRSAPYSKRGPKSHSSDKKQRKKQQNKDAALRYRQKKKDEGRSVVGECDQLETRNNELKDQVEGLSREIGYLKDLMTQVYRAKGVALPSVLTSTATINL